MLAEGITLSEQVDLPGAAPATRRARPDLLRTGQAQSRSTHVRLHRRRHPSRAVPIATGGARRRGPGPPRTRGQQRHPPRRQRPAVHHQSATRLQGRRDRGAGGSPMGRIYRETTPAMMARVTAALDERIGRALAVAAYLLRERRDSRAVDGGEGL
jgi:hypothetical protein